jgi:hypothetical protein
MSPIPLKADMCGALAYVCFGPIADMRPSYNHLDQTLERGFGRARSLDNQDGSKAGHSPILKLGSEWRSLSQRELQPQKPYLESCFL